VQNAQAALVTGGRAPERDGYFFEPTLFDGVVPDEAIFTEEVFGPVVGVTPFSDPEQAASLANATPYGLIAAIWTENVNTAHWLARELRVGQVFVNTYGAGGGVELPFGGYKRSGHGREKGYDALLAYTRSSAWR
jgi:aldehyde dehydrogenase (NAD+)